MKISKLSNTLLYSNKNVEKLLKGLINESSNAVLMETFDDKCILADHTTGNIYQADYNFDGKQVVFENFEQIDLERDNSNLVEAIGKYLDDEATTDDLNESYEMDSENEENTFSESIVEALSSKNMDNIIDYSELEGINEEIGDFKDSSFFKAYKNRLDSNPSNSIKFFNFKDPVKVSLIDEDENCILSKNLIQKSLKLKSDKEFRETVMEASDALMNGDSSLAEEMINEEPSFLALDNSGMTELVGMSVIGNKDLMENRKEIVEAFNNLISENDEICAKKNQIDAAAAETDDNSGAAADVPDASSNDIDELIKALDKALDKVTDQKLVDKIGALKNALEDNKENEQTDVKNIKEAVEILSM